MEECQTQLTRPPRALGPIKFVTLHGEVATRRNINRNSQTGMHKYYTSSINRLEAGRKGDEAGRLYGKEYGECITNAFPEWFDRTMCA